MEFSAILKELTYKSVCRFLIVSSLFFAVACVAQHEEDKTITINELCIFKEALYNIPIDSIDRQIYKASFLNKHRGKYSYCLEIYASNDTISKESLKNKIDSIVKNITLLMEREGVVLYDFQAYYYSENMNLNLNYEIDKNEKIHLRQRKKSPNDRYDK